MILLLSLYLHAEEVGTLMDTILPMWSLDGPRWRCLLILLGTIFFKPVVLYVAVPTQTMLRQWLVCPAVTLPVRLVHVHVWAMQPLVQNGICLYDIIL